MKPFMKYLDTQQYIYLSMPNSAVPYDVTLTSLVSMWIDYDKDLKRQVFRAADLKLKTHKLTPIYSNSTTLDENRHLARGMYQVLSPLLYCIQVQLSGSEFFLKGGSVNTNTTSPIFTVPYYYMVKPGQVRVCASQYIRKLRNVGTKASNTYSSLC